MAEETEPYVGIRRHDGWACETYYNLGDASMLAEPLSNIPIPAIEQYGSEGEERLCV